MVPAADNDAAPGESAEGQGAAATAGKNGAKPTEGAEQAGATAISERTSVNGLPRLDSAAPGR